MPIFPLTLILISAFLHATYNFFIKKSKDKIVFIWWTFLLFSIGLLFILIVKDHVISPPLGSPHFTPFEGEGLVDLGLSFLRYDPPSMIK